MQIDNIDLKWMGHAGFLILYEGKNIYIDPYKLKPGTEKADIILITHSHYDHCSIEDLSRIVKDGSVIVCTADCQSKLAKLREKIDVKIAEPGKLIDLSIGEVKCVEAYNPQKQFHPKDEGWCGYILEIGGKRIYHAGDTDLIPEMSTFTDIDIALLPVGGTYTMSAKEAVQAAQTIKPKLAVPMHYGSEVVGTEEDALKFVQGCEEEGIHAEKLEIGK